MPHDQPFMTNAEKAAIIRRAMKNAKSGDFERSEKLFANLTDDELNENFGFSGQTKRQIRDTYRTDRARWEAANALLTELLDARGL